MPETKIEWCDYTMNPWLGCMKVSPGCDNCFAEAMMDKRYHRVTWGQRKTETTEPSVGTRVRTSPANWRLPLKWARKAREQIELFDEGMLTLRPHRPRVFCSSLADVFDNQVDPFWRVDLFRLIASTPELDWLLLTKRPENVRKMLPWGELLQKPWPNVWLGFTAEDQEHFDRRWPIMREIPAVVRFCSYEPAIGPLRLPPTVELMSVTGKGLHWLICGGESGKGHRDMPLTWERDIRADCARAGVAYFFKQLAGKAAIPPDFPLVRQFPEVRHG